MIGLDSNLVKVVPYDDTWAEEYEKEKTILRNLLKDFDVEIEHVGSTSIKGLSAKPVIDIAIGTKDEKTLFLLVSIMTASGYDMLDEYEEKGEFLARKGTPDNRTHYIHIQLIGSNYWNEFIYFKKYLLEHPEEIAKYEKLKRELSQKYAKERKLYTAGKNEYISAILEKAYKLYGVK